MVTTYIVGNVTKETIGIFVHFLIYVMVCAWGHN